MSFYLFNLTPPFLEGSPPFPLHFLWRGTPPLMMKKLMGFFFYEGFYVHPFVSPSCPFLLGCGRDLLPPNLVFVGCVFFSCIFRGFDV